MTYDQPYYRRSEGSLFQFYSIRILVSLVGCLGLFLLLSHVPLSSSSPRVGWTQRGGGDLIALTEIAPEEKEPATSREEATAPPPTLHLPPNDNSDAGSSEEDETAEASPNESANEPQRTVRSIKGLSSKDQQPEILGGRGALNLYINYPAAAREEGVEGQLKVAFTVGTDGQARHIEVSKSLHPLCDSAAVHAIKSVRFRPGTYNGEPVPIRMSLPIRFQLETQSDPLHSNRSTDAGR